MKDKIQYTTVKVTTTKDSYSNVDSGTIIKKNGEYYIITTEHCVFGKRDSREIFQGVTATDISVEYRQKFNDNPTSLTVRSIVETNSENDYAILLISSPNIDFDFKTIELGYFSDSTEKSCFFRGYAKVHPKEPRTYNCIFKEKSNEKLLFSLEGDTFNQAVDSGAEIASGISGSGIFYFQEDTLFLVGIITELRDSNGTYDDFYALSVSEISFFSDRIKSIENSLIEKSANKFLIPLQSKLGIPNVDFVLTGTDSIPFDPHISLRKEYIKSLASFLQENEWLAITGIIYSGKTELLKLIYRNIPKSKVVIINILTEESEESIIQRIQSISSENDIEYLILDNLPQLGNNSRLLALLFQIIENASFKIISSSRFPLPSKAKNRSNIISTTISDFTIDDVKEIILSYNQPQEIADKYALFILSISRNNPAIISSICAFFQEKKWKIDMDDFTKILSGNYDIDFAIELNDLLSTTVSEPLNRELLNRLQLHNGGFSREIVEIVGNITPEIPELNSRFLKLIGLWIFSLSTDLFKVSPLLQIINNGNPDLARPISQNINIALAGSIIRKRSLNASDVHNIILYYNRANKPNEAGFFYMKYMVIAIDNVEEIKSSILPYYWIDLPLPEEMDIHLKVQIRFIQAHFLRIINKETNYVLTDLERLSKIIPERGIDAYLANATLGAMYANPIDTTPKSFNYLLEAYKSSKILNQEIINHIREYRDDIEMLWFMFSQIVHQTDIDGWFFVLSDTINSNKSKGLESSDIYEGLTFLFYKRFKEKGIKEIEEKHNCDITLMTLLDLLDKLKTFDLENTRLQTVCLIIQLYDLSGNKGEAIRFFTKELDSFVKKEYKGILYFTIITVLLFEDKSKINELLTPEIENVLVNTVKMKSGFSIILDGLCTLISYYKDIDIRKSLFYSKLAYDYSLQDERQFEVISQSLVVGEYAVTLWENGEKEKSMEILDIGFRKLLTVVSDDEKYKVLIMKYGILIRYIALQGKEDRYEYVIPRIGMFFLNQNSDKLIEVYDPIRDFFYAHFMFDIFKSLKNTHKTEYWALYSNEISQSIPNNPYTILMLSFIPYLVKEKMYEEVINILYKDNEEIERIKRGESQYLEIMKKLQPERETSKEEIHDRKITSDEEMLIIYIMPMLVNALDYYQVNKDKKYLQEIVKILKRHLEFCIDKTIVEECIEIIDIFIKQEGIIKYSFPLKNEINVLKCIVYLLGSFSVDVKQSFDLQMKLIVYVDNSFNLYEIEKDFLLYDFFRNFWLKRIYDCSSEFESYQHLQNKGINTINKGGGKNLNRLFRVLSNHININLNTEQENWLDL